MTLELPVQADAVGTDRWYLSAPPIARALVHLCAPMPAAMIVGAVYNVINAGFIGSLHAARADDVARRSGSRACRSAAAKRQYYSSETVRRAEIERSKRNQQRRARAAA